MNIFRTSVDAVRAIATALLIAAAAAITLLGAAALEAREDVAPAGAALAEAARAVATGNTPEAAPEAQRLLVDAGLDTARITAPDGTVIATRGAPARWEAPAAGSRAWPAQLGAGDWSLREGVLEGRAAFADGGTLAIRTGRRAEHGEIGGLVPIVVVALLTGAVVSAILLVARRRREEELEATTAAIAALPAPPDRRRARGGRWAALHRELRRAGSRWRVADGRRGPAEIAALLDPLDHAVATRDARGARVDNPALDSLRARLFRPDATALDARVQDLLMRRGACADRVVVGAGHLDIEAWDAGDLRIATVTDRQEAERLAALRRRIAGAGRRHLTAPLTEIRRQADGLADRRGDPRPLRIIAAADRLEAVIARMLREQDAPGETAALPPVGLPGLLWGMARRWDEELRSRALRVELDLAPGLPRVNADPSLLDEILSELVENAARFSPRGQAIAVAATGDGNGVTVVVRDAGPGIDAADASAATEPFWRSPDADAVPGAGLGLGVASVLAQRIGGALEIDPGPGGSVRLVLAAAGPAVAEAA